MLKLTHMGGGGEGVYVDYRAILFMIILLAFALRGARLDFQPLWHDEGYSLYFATSRAPELLAETAVDIHPPFYYLLLRYWLRRFGSAAPIVRLLSVFAGTLTIPLFYHLARRLMPRRAALIAAFILAIAPLHIYYSQEVRMYAPVTLLGVASMYFMLKYLALPLPKWALAYVVVTTLAMHTQYYGAFIPLAQTIFVIIYVIVKRPGRIMLRLWLILQAILLVLYLPWLIYAGPKLYAYVTAKVAHEAYAPRSPAIFFWNHLAAFGVGHAPPRISWLAAFPIVLAIWGYNGLSPLAKRTWSKRLLLATYLFVPLFAGYVINLIYPFNPPRGERLLLLCAPAFYLLVALGIDWLRGRATVIFWGALAFMTLINALSLHDFYTAPRYTDDDYRPLIEYIENHALPEDVILCTYQWQMGYFESYYRGEMPRLYEIPEWGKGWDDDAARLTQELTALMSKHGRLWFPAHQTLGHIIEDKIEAELAARYYPVYDEWQNAATRLLFYIDDEDCDTIQELSRPFGFVNKVSLESYCIGTEPLEAGWDAARVDLYWQRTAPLAGTYRIALRLVGAGGYVWQSRDAEPRAVRLPFAESSADELVLDRHGLLIPAGTPAGAYQVRLSNYATNGEALGGELILGEVTVTAPRITPPIGALKIQTPRRVDFDDSTRLLGYNLPDDVFEPGNIVAFELFWDADGVGNTAVVQLENTAVIQEIELRGGELLRTPGALLLPADLPDGAYAISIELAGKRVELTKITVAGRARNFTRPPIAHEQAARLEKNIELLGYDVNVERAAPGGELYLRLFWKCRAPMTTSYKVFVHLLDAHDEIRGQQDSVPGNWTLPTTGWVAGEYIVDDYAVPIDADAPPGDYRLAAGMYDAETGTRLTVYDENGAAVGDKVILDYEVDLR